MLGHLILGNKCKDMIVKLKYVVFLFLALTVSNRVQAQKSKAELKRFIQNREAILKGNNFWSNDSVSLQTYLIFDSLTLNLFRGALFYPQKVTSKKSKIEGTDLSLVMYDFTKDGIPDEFVYENTEGIRSRDFGLMFDLNKDGKYDYIVFNGGFAMSHDGEFFFYFYHMIDSNYDGVIDIDISSVMVQPGDEMPDPHKILWVSDTNFDKKAEVFKIVDIRNGASIPIDVKDGVWRFKSYFGELEVSPSDDTYFNAFTNVLNDLNEE
jgi:hypothetical protein